MLPSCVQGLGARARRDNLRRTWVPTGKALQALEDDKGVVIRFLIGYRSAAARAGPQTLNLGGWEECMRPACHQAACPGRHAVATRLWC